MRICRMVAFCCFGMAVSAMPGRCGEHTATEKAPQVAPPHAEERLAPPAAPLTPDAALARIKEGHARFLAGRATHPHQDKAIRRETASEGQDPCAVIVTCSDSRVPPEVIFDQGIGDLFIIRTAGHVCREIAVASIEYGTDHLKTPLLLILGHTQCGAITAAEDGGHVSATLEPLVADLRPAVDEARKRLPDATPEAVIAEAIEAHVRLTIRDILSRSPTIRAQVARGELRIVGAIYDIDSGSVRWLPDAPPAAKAAPKSRPEEAPLPTRAE